MHWFDCWWISHLTCNMYPHYLVKVSSERMVWSALLHVIIAMNVIVWLWLLWTYQETLLCMLDLASRIHHRMLHSLVVNVFHFCQVVCRRQSTLLCVCVVETVLKSTLIVSALIEFPSWKLTHFLVHPVCCHACCTCNTNAVMMMLMVTGCVAATGLFVCLFVYLLVFLITHCCPTHLLTC